jgi:tetratricopeptide (TPR) repeat protein
MVNVRNRRIIWMLFIIFGALSKAYSQNYYNQNFKKGYYYLDVSISQAAEYFGKAIMNDSTQPEAFFYRGLAYYKLDKFSDAIRDFKKALEIDTTLVKINVFISFAYRGLNNWDKALDSFNEYMIRSSVDSTSFNWLMRGKLKQLNGDITGAL